MPQPGACMGPPIMGPPWPPPPLYGFWLRLEEIIRESASLAWGMGEEEGGGGGVGRVPLLRRGSANAHGPVAAVDTLHLLKSALLVALLGEAHEAVAARLAGVGVGHDLGRLARGEAGLEQRDQDVLGDLGAKVADEDRELGAAVVAVSRRSCQDESGQECKRARERGMGGMGENIPTINQTTTRSPVQLVVLVLGAVNGGASKAQSLGGSLGRGELDEAVAGVAAEISIRPSENQRAK